MGSEAAGLSGYEALALIRLALSQLKHPSKRDAGIALLEEAERRLAKG